MNGRDFPFPTKKKPNNPSEREQFKVGEVTMTGVAQKLYSVYINRHCRQSKSGKKKY